MTEIKHIESVCISYRDTTEKGLNGKIKKQNQSIIFFTSNDCDHYSILARRKALNEISTDR